MLTQLEKLDGRLASIDGNLAVIAEVCLTLAKDGRLERLMDCLPALKPHLAAPSEPEAAMVDDGTAEKQHFAEHELMTVKEASACIPASRSKIFEWRMDGTLQTVERNCRNIRLIRNEVKALRTWARNKGKR